MNFITDKQTLDDLNILGKYKNNSIFKLFNQVRTGGGERLLENMFQKPLSDEQQINNRSETFRYFQSNACPFPFNAEQISKVENYLGMGGSGRFLTMAINGLRKKALKMLGLVKEYELVNEGILETASLIKQVQNYLTQLGSGDRENPFQEQIETIDKLYRNKKLERLVGLDRKGMSTFQFIHNDYLIRQVFIETLKEMLHVVYEIDVNTAVSTVAKQNHFSYALVLPKEENLIQLEEVWHPWVKKAVANTINIDRFKNVVFLTGANMAGKSTFMKSFGIAIYLAHMGFPIPAKQMTISVQDGIYTSINVPDNLNAGYSHFYAEVLRVKKVAEEVARGKNMVVIFDELFKGTNVKDAFDATVAVTEAFSELRNCSYIISTHIIEAADELKRLDNFSFVFLPTIMQGTVPQYTYKLQKGVTEDRHGKMIIDNERIVEIILGDKLVLDQK